MSHWSTKPSTSFVSVPIRYEDVHILCVSADSEAEHILCVSADSICDCVHQDRAYARKIHFEIRAFKSDTVYMINFRIFT